jgi:hypothetical protein
VHRDADQLAADFLTFARVNPCPDVQADPAQVLADRHRAPDGAGCAVEGDEEAVTSGVNLAAAKAADLVTDDRVVFGQQLAPAVVAELSRPLGRADDVGETTVVKTRPDSAVISSATWTGRCQCRPGRISTEPTACATRAPSGPVIWQVAIAIVRPRWATVARAVSSPSAGSTGRSMYGFRSIVLNPVAAGTVVPAASVIAASAR